MLEDQLGEDTRVTILGHVQRGGAPSAFDRSMSSILGYAAVEEVLAATPDSVPQLIGIHGNRVAKVPLMDCVAQTRKLAKLIAAKDFDIALAMRGDSYTEMLHVFTRDLPRAADGAAAGRRRSRIAVRERRRTGARHECGGAGGRPARAGPRARHARGRRAASRA